MIENTDYGLVKWLMNRVDEYEEVKRREFGILKEKIDWLHTTVHLLKETVASHQKSIDYLGSVIEKAEKFRPESDPETIKEIDPFLNAVNGFKVSPDGDITVTSKRRMHISKIPESIMNNRTKSSLYREEFNYIDELKDFSDNELGALYRVGDIGVASIKKALQVYQDRI
jgi:hypothetical protein